MKKKKQKELWEEIIEIFDMYDTSHTPFINLEELMEPIYQKLFEEYCTKLEKDRFLPFNLY